MATVMKETSKVAKKIRKVEDFLREQGVKISYRPEGIIYLVEEEEIDKEGNKKIVESPFVLLGESWVMEVEAPSFAEPTRIQPLEHYIKGT